MKTPPFGLFDLALLAKRYDWTLGSARALHNRSEKRRRDKDARSGDLPEPDTRLGGAPVWHLDTLIDWDDRRPGRGAGGGRPPADDDV